MNEQPTVSVSVAMKVNLGNYESADAFLSVSGLEAGTPSSAIEELLDTGQLAWSILSRRLDAKVNELRNGHGRGAAIANEPPPYQPPPQQQYAPPAPAQTPQDGPTPPCHYCNGQVWDNRRDKRNPKAPDFKCKNNACGGAAWIQKDGGIKWSNKV